MKGLSKIKETQLNAVLLMLDGNNESDTDSEKKLLQQNYSCLFFLSYRSVASAIPTNYKLSDESSFYTTLN